jgi:hypothetical protein
VSVYFNPEMLRVLTEERLAEAQDRRLSASYARVLGVIDRLGALARRALGSDSDPLETPCA